MDLVCESLRNSCSLRALRHCIMAFTLRAACTPWPVHQGMTDKVHTEFSLGVPTPRAQTASNNRTSRSWKKCKNVALTSADTRTPTCAGLPREAVREVARDTGHRAGRLTEYCEEAAASERLFRHHHGFLAPEKRPDSPDSFSLKELKTILLF